jgi:N-acetylglucosaminyldiphosphoundecaprenol N-acetyl-beta-D-mannosaminyltransferase
MRRTPRPQEEAMEPADRPELLGCRFDRVGMREAIARCVGWCRGPRRPHTVVTANAATLCLMRRDPALREACRRADLVVPDGMSVVWTSRLAGLGLPERVTGVDLMVRLLEAASEHGLSIYLLGAQPAIVRELARRCRAAYPGLSVAGFRDGYFAPGDHAAVIADVRRSAPHMLFVGMPSPFKETWCEENREALGVPVMLGVGGTFDVLAGHVRRAPRPVQAAGLEWAWRLAMEPRRLWRRYLFGNTEYAWLAAGAVLRRRAHHASRHAR